MENFQKASFIYGAVRTPIGKFNGGLATVSAPELGAIAIREAVRRSSISPDQFSEVFMGNVVSAGIGQAPARQAALKSGLPESIGATTINKVCASGLKAVMLADQAVRLGEAEFVVAGGMENMSCSPFLLPQVRRGHKLGNTEMVDSMIHDGLWDPHENQHMGELCEQVLKQFCFSREKQDHFARTSYLRAREAQEDGTFAREIAVVTLHQKGKQQAIEKDEQPYEEDLDQLSFMHPVFKKEGGTLTKGNSAKINDGAAALVIGKEIRGLDPMARIVSYATHAQSPATFGLAPFGAIQKVLARTDLSLDDIDLFEINEAFAGISMAVNDLLGLDGEKVNIHGGSIALGHPIGATGARILVTLLYALEKRNLKRGLAGLCIGGGEAIAMIVERM
ncbi:MAG: acetyl-CoA C-acyltransferase [Candidatus Nitronauta litoralis]|uniref:Acetyl-CoA C-acyltransferase n=1 Tax=Candidatus Nitronauta litoralis TaxID=2705533 RepID=A0A7T0BVC3_9BACT|nr:MAG: acetyl-CoA C-acyltransferase [Candidatus Nitronauta litoralis]